MAISKAKLLLLHPKQLRRPGSPDPFRLSPFPFAFAWLSKHLAVDFQSPARSKGRGLNCPVH
jgi:hypothetical protein